MKLLWQRLDDAIQRTNATDVDKVELTKVAWVISQVSTSDAKTFALYKSIE